MTGLDKLVKIGNAFRIISNNKLKSLDGIDNLAFVQNDLTVQENESLESLNGIEKLTFVGGWLSIHSNSKLTDINSLNTELKVVDQLVIANNTNLSICSVRMVCQYLADSSAKTYIMDNASGCESREKIQETCTALPVTLISFSAKQSEMNVELLWKTSLETNSDYFEIQHSTDGRTWQKIGKINSNHESTVERSYSFVHLQPALTTNYYRLKMVDYDMSLAYSRIVAVSMQKIITATVTDLGDDIYFYPNPVINSVFIKNKKGAVISKVELLELTGKKLFEGNYDVKNGLDLSDYPTGSFVLVVTYPDGTRLSAKIMKK